MDTSVSIDQTSCLVPVGSGISVFGSLTCAQYAMSQLRAMRRTAFSSCESGSSSARTLVKHLATRAIV
jgi:hypothetical protein